MLLLLFAGVLFLAGCDDTAPYYGEGMDSEYNRYYSNKLAKDPMAGTLDLTYSGEELVGKEIYFHLMTENTAKIVLKEIIYGVSELTYENHPVTANGDGSYSFSGTETTSKGISFSYQGKVSNEAGAILPDMTLEVKDVKFPENELARKGTFNTMDFSSVGNSYYCPLYFQWKVLGLNGQEEHLLNLTDYGIGDLTSAIYMFLPKILYLMLPDITFHADGNVTATYAPLPEDLDIMMLMYIPVNASMRAETSVSPMNLFTYYIDDNKFYLRPDISQIVHSVTSNNSTRADDDDSAGLDLGSLLEYLNLILGLVDSAERWINEGICFNLVPNDPTVGQALMDVPGAMFEGDYQLYLDINELGIIVELLPLILDLFDVDLSGVPVIGNFSDILLDRARNTTALDLGVILNENF